MIFKINKLPCVMLGGMYLIIQINLFVNCSEVSPRSRSMHGVLNVRLIVNDSNHTKSYKVKTTTILVKFTNKFTETS